jgi:hypothetical protein
MLLASMIKRRLREKWGFHRSVAQLQQQVLTV